MSVSGFKPQPTFIASGVPIISRNSILDKDGFYISYLPYDHNYDGATTALVMDEQFYILNGDHREAYTKLTTKEECEQYFINNYPTCGSNMSTPPGHKFYFCNSCKRARYILRNENKCKHCNKEN